MEDGGQDKKNSEGERIKEEWKERGKGVEEKYVSVCVCVCVRVCLVFQEEVGKSG